MSELDRDVIEMLYEDDAAFWAGEEVITRGAPGHGSRKLSLDAWQREVEVGRARGGSRVPGLPRIVGQNEATLVGVADVQPWALERWQREVEVGGSHSRQAATGLAGVHRHDVVGRGAA